MRGNAAAAALLALGLLAAAAAPAPAGVEGVLVGNGDKITASVANLADTGAVGDSREGIPRRPPPPPPARLLPPGAGED